MCRRSVPEVLRLAEEAGVADRPQVFVGRIAAAMAANDESAVLAAWAQHTASLAGFWEQKRLGDDLCRRVFRPGSELRVRWRRLLGGCTQCAAGKM